jgi:hypothetical protein
MASRGDESSDVTVLEHDSVMFAPDAVHGGTHHGLRQVVSANRLVGEQTRKTGYIVQRKSMTCPEEVTYVDMLRTTDLLSRVLALHSSNFYRLRIDVFFRSFDSSSRIPVRQPL